MANNGVTIRPARTLDIEVINELMQPLVAERILLGKELVSLYEAVQEFMVAEYEGEIVGFGALHVMWKYLGEVRTIASVDRMRGKGVGHALLEALEERARQLGLKRLFCLTFETEFFGRHGYERVGEDDSLVKAEVYSELLRSTDDGVAEFLDLARVKQNTLGNTRMIKYLP